MCHGTVSLSFSESLHLIQASGDFPAGHFLLKQDCILINTVMLLIIGKQPEDGYVFLGASR
jgi:hypothetical protein